jgi:hypothetical protein
MSPQQPGSGRMLGCRLALIFLAVVWKAVSREQSPVRSYGMKPDAPKKRLNWTMAEMSPFKTDNGEASSGRTPESEMPQDVRVALEDAILLHKFAIERSKSVDHDVTRTIAEMRAQDVTEKWSIEKEVKFWDAYRKLNSIISPINADTIRAISPDKSKSVNFRNIFSNSPASIATRYYRYWGIAALLFVLYLQIYLTLGSALVSDLAEFCPSLNRTDIQGIIPENLQAENNGSTPSTKVSDKDLNCETLLSLRANQPGDKTDVDSARLYSIVESITDMNYVNILWIFHQYIFPYFYESSSHGNSIGGNGTYKDILEIYFLQLGLDVINKYFLPLTYGLLGACAYIIRTVSVEIQNVLYSRETHSRYQLRLFLGALAGLSAAWFISSNNNTMAIPAAALSFLAGYSVELVFTAMDRFVTAFGSEAGRTRSGTETSNRGSQPSASQPSASQPS